MFTLTARQVSSWIEHPNKANQSVHLKLCDRGQRLIKIFHSKVGCWDIKEKQFCLNFYGYSSKITTTSCPLIKWITGNNLNCNSDHSHPLQKIQQHTLRLHGTVSENKVRFFRFR